MSFKSLRLSPGISTSMLESMFCRFRLSATCEPDIGFNIYSQNKYSRTSAVLTERFSQNRRKFFLRSRKCSSNRGNDSGLMSKTQTKVIVEIQIWKVRGGWNYWRYPLWRIVRMRRPIRGKRCFSDEGDVGGVCHSVWHHVMKWFGAILKTSSFIFKEAVDVSTLS